MCDDGLDNPQEPQVTAEELQAEELRQRYLEIIDRRDIYPTVTNWKYIIEHRMTGLGPALMHKYLCSLDRSEDDREPLHLAAIEYFPQYLAAVPRQYAVETVYSDTDTMPGETARLIRDIRLFDAAAILEHMQAGRTEFALDVLDAYRATYDAGELRAVDELEEYIDSIPATGFMEERRGIFGSSMKYICPLGHVNDADVGYCRHCGRDKYGHTEQQAHKIALFKRRSIALHALFDARED